MTGECTYTVFGLVKRGKEKNERVRHEAALQEHAKKRGEEIAGKGATDFLRAEKGDKKSGGCDDHEYLGERSS
jgi:hypothetical protein